MAKSQVGEVNPRYLFVVGPSCSGKSKLALEIAQQSKMPIINCDSVQVFQQVNVGTAKPSPDEQSTTPHFLFDQVPPGKPYSVANYLNDVVDTLKKNTWESLIFCGGSGFYIQALEKGLYPGGNTSQETKDQVWQYIENHGFDGAHKKLLEDDPKFGETVSPNDHYRIRRSLEILAGQEMSLSELREKMNSETHSPLPIHSKRKIGLHLDRSELRKRVEKRTNRMLEQGLVSEVEELIAGGWAEWSPLKSVGYREVVECLRGHLPREELAAKITTSTMQLIKKQTTWFKKDPKIKWYKHDDWAQAVRESLHWLNDES